MSTAEKRRLYTQLTWWFGGFYDGTLDQFEWTGAWNPIALITVEFNAERTTDSNQLLVKLQYAWRL